MSTRETVRVAGPDAAAYLQGQISQDVDALVIGEPAWSLVLQPTGKVDAWFRIQRIDDQTFLLDVDAGHRDTLVARLSRFLLRTDATIEPVDTTIDSPVEWPGAADPTDERQRILAGMPRMGSELTEDTIPGEGGQRLIDLSVSFTKGCYTGQELVARIDSRGGNSSRDITLLGNITNLVMNVGAGHRRSQLLLSLLKYLFAPAHNLESLAALEPYLAKL